MVLGVERRKEGRQEGRVLSCEGLKKKSSRVMEVLTDRPKCVRVKEKWKSVAPHYTDMNTDVHIDSKRGIEEYKWIHVDIDSPMRGGVLFSS